jgi:hypothetical protein
MILQPNPSRHRIERKRAVIIADDGELVLGRVKDTQMTDEGATTEETIYSVIINGERVTSHLQLVGQCYRCRSFVTHRSVRYCQCGRVLCICCSELWADESRPVCEDCHKALRWSKFWSTLRSIFISPFIERREP